MPGEHRRNAAIVIERSEADGVSLPAGIRRSAGYFPELESLRGLAIALVVAFHTDGLVHVLQKARPAPSVVFALVRAGNAGVDLFFVLSAFLLARPFLVARDRGLGSVDLRRYFARRALRILPLYWTVAITTTVLTAAQPADILRGVPLLAFVHTSAPPPQMTPYATVWWSLATEVQFYLLLPVLGMVRRSAFSRSLAAGSLVLWAVAYVTCLARPSLQADESVWLFATVFGRAPAFLFGIGAAALYLRHGETLRRWLHTRPVMRAGGADALLAAIVVLLMLLLREVAGRGFPAAERAPFQLWHVGSALLWTAFLGLVLVAPLRCRPLVHNRALTALGIVSYSVYLWHILVVWPCLRALKTQWPGRFNAWTPETMAAAAVIATLVLAWAAVSYRFVERPFLRVKSSLG
ncbi:MAG: acyltransferase [Candidatus Binatia bacterium]